MVKNLLLADDSVTIRKVVELTFSDTNIRVQSVASGEAALEQIGKEPPDLLLADVVMPEPSGYELCRRVKSSDHPIPVLLLAGAFEAFDERRARECGADGHLLKPFESQTLIDTVQSLLAGERLGDGPADPPAEVVGLEEEAIDLVEPPTGSPAEDALQGIHLAPETIERLARAVVERLSVDLVREIAREIAPRVAETARRENEGEPGEGAS